MDNILELVVVDRNPLLVDNVPVLERNLVRRLVDVDPYRPLNVDDLLDVLLDRLVLVSVDDNGTVVDDVLKVVDYAANNIDRIDPRRDSIGIDGRRHSSVVRRQIGLRYIILLIVNRDDYGLTLVVLNQFFNINDLGFSIRIYIGKGISVVINISSDFVIIYHTFPLVDIPIIIPWSDIILCSGIKHQQTVNISIGNSRGIRS